MFNPIPKDAPEFFTTKAHYIDVHHTLSARGVEMDRNKVKSRFYIFSIGRSVKNYMLRDKYLDDNALRILEQTRNDKTRLVLKGYTSPSNGTTMFVVLTHFGVYHKPNRSDYRVYNPDNGELGFYKLRTG